MSEIDKRIAEARRKKAQSVRDSARKRLDTLPSATQASTRHARCRRTKAERKLREAEAALASAQAHEMDIKTPPAKGRRCGLRL